MQRESKSSPLLLLGLFLLAAGGLLSGISGPRAYMPRLLLLAGVAALAWGAVRSGASLRFFLFRARTVAEPGPSLNWALAGLVLLVVATGLGLSGSRLDLTKRGVNSLSETSRHVLKELDRDVELISAYRENALAYDQASEALRVYQAASRHIRVKRVDPDREPDEARALGLTRPNVLVVRAGEVSEEIEELEESDITQAILRVEDPNRPVIAVLDGHGELREGRSPFTALRGAMSRSGLVYKTLRLGEYVEVPPEARAVLIAGPETKLLPGEVDALRRFLSRGGRVAVLVEPEVSSGLESLCREEGIEIDGRRVIDESPLSRSLGLGPEVVAINRWGEHPITNGLGVGLVLAGTTRVGLVDKPVWGTSGTDLARTGSGAHLAPSPENPTASPSAALPLAAALEWEATGSAPAAGKPAEKSYARLVVVGDSDFARDSHIDLYGNKEFATRILGWLTEREYLLRFPSVDKSGTPLRVGLAGLRAIFYGAEILIPLLAFGLAFRAWARRR
ncbi:MAG: GldG family protein [Candidatus Eisenbacteria bacterium]